MKRGTSFERIISDIKSVKVQGAENVCKEGIGAYLLNPTKKSKEILLKTRPTEPLLKNALDFIESQKNKNLAAKSFIKNLEKAHKAIARKGAALIKNDMSIYSHCHSSTVMDILKYARKVKKKRFVVYTTEVEPLLQGRKTAQDLGKSGIKVVIAPDLAAGEILKKCDLFLFGADAFTSKFVANKIGTTTLVRLAKSRDIPRYSCGTSLKFTKKIKIEKRSPREVWGIQKKKIKIENPAFDKTRLKDISGIVCEHGIIYSRDKFARKAKEALGW